MGAQPGFSVTVMILAGVLPSCGSCDPDGVETLEARLVVDPGEVDFGERAVGVMAVRELRLENAGTRSLRLQSAVIEAAIAGQEGDSLLAFRMASALPEELAPGDSTVVRLEARGTQVGVEEGVLYVESNDGVEPRRLVRLRLTVVPAPPCDDGNQCTRDRFDPEIDACVHEFDDGARCFPADRCILEATCSQGVCLGESRVCDDGSACTRDLCRQSDGVCLFIPDDSACDDGNSCTEDRCEEGRCVHTGSPNGTPCNDGDGCTVGDVCFSGECLGLGVSDGNPCNDGDSCTTDDVCIGGACGGTSMIDGLEEGDIVFRYSLADLGRPAFLHRREVSLGDDGTLFGLDHHGAVESDPEVGFIHEAFAMVQCGTPVYSYTYRPPDRHVQVRNVWRQMQLSVANQLRLLVAVRHLESPLDDDLNIAFTLETTTYVLDRRGEAQSVVIKASGAEIGRALLPDGSVVHARLVPLNEGPTTPEQARQNLTIVREDRSAAVLWRHDREASVSAEFLGVAGPRILFWTNGRLGALDFNTGSTVWTQATDWVSREMAHSTDLNLGVARTFFQIIGVDLLRGTQTFVFPTTLSFQYMPLTDPIIANDGRILLMMELRQSARESLGLDWVELSADGRVLSQTRLPYAFPDERSFTRAEDGYADPTPTVADDGVSYVGYGDRFFAIDPGGRIRWTLEGDSPDAFTGTVPLLRADGVLLISHGSREVLGVKTNGGRMASGGWASFRHDNRRTNYTP